MTAAIVALLLISIAAFVGYWLGIWMLWLNRSRKPRTIHLLDVEGPEGKSFEIDDLSGLTEVTRGSRGKS